MQQNAKAVFVTMTWMEVPICGSVVMGKTRPASPTWVRSSVSGCSVGNQPLLMSGLLVPSAEWHGPPSSSTWFSGMHGWVYLCANTHTCSKCVLTTLKVFSKLSLLVTVFVDSMPAANSNHATSDALQVTIYSLAFTCRPLFALTIFGFLCLRSVA